MEDPREDSDADEVWRIYILLTRVEAAFRARKSPLGERPIRRHKERRVEAHIFLCVPAYHLLISIGRTLLDQGVHTSRASAREILKTHQASTVVMPVVGGGQVRIRAASAPEPAHQEIYDPPRIAPEVLRRRIWLEPMEPVR